MFYNIKSNFNRFIFFTYFYKYIKNLALAISDTISLHRGTKQVIYDTYSDRYKDIFKGGKTVEIPVTLKDIPYFIKKESK